VSLPEIVAGEGQYSLDLCFDTLEECSPDAQARKARALLKLLAAREQQQTPYAGGLFDDETAARP